MKRLHVTGFGVRLGLALVAGAAVVAAVAAAQFQPGAESEILGTLAAMRNLVRQGDAARLVELYTPDAQIISSERVIQGRDALRAYMSVTLGLIGDFRNEDQEFFAGDGIAVETGHSQFLDKSGTVIAASRYMTLWKKGADGQWRIARDIGVSDAGSASARQGPPAAFDVKTEPAAYAVVLPMTGSYQQHLEAMVRVAVYLTRIGIKPLGGAFGRYYNSPENGVAEANLRWEVGFFVAGKPAVATPFQVREFPPSKVAYAVVDGPRENPRPWSAFGDWLLKQGYAPMGPPMEIWLDANRTEMRVQVEQPAGR